MILVFADDSTVNVYDDQKQLLIDCEETDIEDGIYTFTDEHGFLLRPIFSKRQYLFGQFLSSEEFQLEASSESNVQLLFDFLENRVFFNKGTKSICNAEQLKTLILEANPDLYQKPKGG